MIALLPILLLALLDVPDEGRHRATRNELQNRLGMRSMEEGGGDLRSRILYALSLIPESMTIPEGQQETPDRPARDAGVYYLRWPVISALYQILEHVDLWAIPTTHVAVGPHHRIVIRASNAIDTIDAEGRLQAQNEGRLGVSVPGTIWNGQWTPALPSPGLRSRLDPILAWIVREILRDEREMHGENLRHRVMVRQEHPPLRDYLGQRTYLDQFLDWFEAVHPNLSPMTFTEAWAAQEAWHRQFATTAAFRSALPPGIPIAIYPDGARIVRLATKKQCEEEGLAMGHCVGGYWSSVREGDDVVLSYRDPAGIPQVTVDLTFWTRNPTLGLKNRLVVNQFKGPEDETVQDAQAAARMIQLLAGAGLITDVDEVEQHLPFHLSSEQYLVAPDDLLASVRRFIADGTLPAEGVVGPTASFKAALQSRSAVRRYRATLADYLSYTTLGEPPPEYLSRIAEEQLATAKQALGAERSLLQFSLEVFAKLKVDDRALQSSTYHYQWQVYVQVRGPDQVQPRIELLAIAPPLSGPRGPGLWPFIPRQLVIRATHNPEAEGDVLRGSNGPDVPEGDGDSLLDALFCRDWIVSVTQQAALREASLVRYAGPAMPTFPMPVGEALTLPLFVFLERAEAAGVKLDADATRTLQRLLRG